MSERNWVKNDASSLHASIVNKSQAAAHDHAGGSLGTALCGQVGKWIYAVWLPMSSLSVCRVLSVQSDATRSIIDVTHLRGVLQKIGSLSDRDIASMDDYC